MRRAIGTAVCAVVGAAIVLSLAADFVWGKGRL